MSLFKTNRLIFHNLNTLTESLGVEIAEVKKSPAEETINLENVFKARQTESNLHFQRCKKDPLYQDAIPNLDEALQSIVKLDQECSTEKEAFGKNWSQESGRLYASLSGDVNPLDEFGKIEDGREEKIIPELIEARQEFAKDLLKGFAETGAGFNSITNALLAVYQAKTQEEALNAWNYLEVGLAIIPLPIVASLKWVRKGSKWIQREAATVKEATPLTRTAQETAEITSREVVNLTGKDAEFVVAYAKECQREIPSNVPISLEALDKHTEIITNLAEFVRQNKSAISPERLAVIDDYLVDVYKQANKLKIDESKTHILKGRKIIQDSLNSLKK